MSALSCARKRACTPPSITFADNTTHCINNSILMDTGTLWTKCTEMRQSDRRSDGRSFNSVQGYAQHSQCAVFLTKELLLNQQSLDAVSSSRIYKNSWITSSVDAEAPMPVMPAHHSLALQSYQTRATTNCLRTSAPCCDGPRLSRSTGG